ncbi:MAG: multidrug ABC transporter ATP-binding protein, partial [Pannonibacter indicus]
KNALMSKLGKKQLSLQLNEPLAAIPESLCAHDLALEDEGRELVYTYDTQGERTGITSLMNDLREAGIAFRDLQTRQDSLEKIFVNLVRQSQ